MSFSHPQASQYKNLHSSICKVFHRRAVLKDATNTHWQAKTLDISEDGCAIIVQQPFKEGLSCAVTIYDNCDGNPVEIKASGVIEYCILSGLSGYRIGIQFSDIEPSSSVLIRKALERT